METEGDIARRFAYELADPLASLNGAAEIGIKRRLVCSVGGMIPEWSSSPPKTEPRLLR